METDAPPPFSPGRIANKCLAPENRGELSRYDAPDGATGLRIDRPDQISATLHKAFDTPGPVLVGVHVDYRQNVKLFEKVYEGSIL